MRSAGSYLPSNQNRLATALFDKPEESLVPYAPIDKQLYIPSAGNFVLLEERNVTAPTGYDYKCQRVLTNEGIIGWCCLNPDSWVEVL